jgi:AmpD protein
MRLADVTPLHPPQWKQGWLSTARQLPSPNFGPRPPDTGPVDLIVVHSISLPPGQFGTGAVQALFTNQLDWQAHPYFQTIAGLEVSAHFFIERTGLLWQFVSCDQRAWHAGVSSHQGRANCNDYSIGIELEGLEGRLFEPAQYQSLTVLCQQLRQQYPISAIAGHEHIAPGRKADPGPGFDWLLLQQQLNWPAHCFTDTAST